MSADPETCSHRFTRPVAKDDPRPFCVSCLLVLDARRGGDLRLVQP